MTQRGGSHNFMFKYAPLRMRGAAQQTINSPSLDSTRFPLPFPPKVPLQKNNPRLKMSSSHSSPSTPNVAESGTSCDVLNSSLDNITNWCQRQEIRNGELQAQLNASINEIYQLKSKLDNSSTEIEQLQFINNKLKESHQQIEKESRNIFDLYNDVKNTITDISQTLEEISKDRNSWLINFEELLKRRYGKKIQELQNEFKTNTQEKDAIIDKERCDNQQNLIQIHDIAFERDRLKEELTEMKAKLDRILDENRKIEEDRSKLEEELNQMKHSFDQMLNEKTKEIINESLEEKASNLANFQELKELREKWAVVEAELAEMKRIELIEPREALRAEIAASRNQIKQLNAINSAKETDLSDLRFKHASVQEALATHEDVKRSMEILSSEMETQKDRFKLLEEKFFSTEEALLTCRKHRDELEISHNLLLEKNQSECNKSREYESKIQELVKQLANYQQMIEENRSKVSELINQLAASEENSRCLQAALDEKNRALEEKVGVEENFQRLKASLEKDVADLKCRLMEKSIELEYKEKRIEEIEKALNECTQSSKTSQQDEPVRSEVDGSRPKTKTEIDKLKTSLNLKNLELESVNDQLKEAKIKISLTEKKVTNLESIVSILEKKLESERKKNSENLESIQYSSQEAVSIVGTVKKDLDQKSGKTKSVSFKKNEDISENLAVKNEDTLTLLQKANAIAKEVEQKRQTRESNYSSVSHLMKPPSPSTSIGRSGKKPRLTKDNPEINWCNSVPESPVIRNKSGVLTTRFVDRKQDDFESHDLNEEEDSRDNFY